MRFQLALLIVYLGLNLLLVLFKVPGSEIFAATDPGRYLDPALALVRHGSIVRLDQPEIINPYAGPLYQVFIAAHHIVFGEANRVGAVVASQIVLLYLTGWFTYRIGARYGVAVGALAQAIVILNPNSFFTAHLIQTETLFTLILTIGLERMLAFDRRTALKGGAAIGLAVGLATLCRPAMLYAILVLPVALWVLAWLAPADHRPWAKSTMAAALAAAVMAVVLVAPWMLRNYHHTGVMAFTSNGGEYLWDNLLELNKAKRALGKSGDPRYAEISLEQRYGILEERYGADWENANLPDLLTSQLLSQTALAELRRQPLDALALGFANSMVRLFASGGSNNVARVLGFKEADRVLEAFDRVGGVMGFFTEFTTVRAHVPAGYLLIHFLPIGLVVVLRILGLFGVWILARRREWSFLALAFGIAAYLSTLYLFVGQSRFRVPLEPPLAVLAAVGAAWLWQRRSVSTR